MLHSLVLLCGFNPCTLRENSVTLLRHFKALLRRYRFWNWEITFFCCHRKKNTEKYSSADLNVKVVKKFVLSWRCKWILESKFQKNRTYDSLLNGSYWKLLAQVRKCWQHCPRLAHWLDSKTRLLGFEASREVVLALVCAPHPWQQPWKRKHRTTACHSEVKQTTKSTCLLIRDRNLALN